MVMVTIFEKVGTAECVCPKFCHIPLLCLGVKRIQQVSIGIPDLLTDFSEGRLGGLVFPSLSEFSTDCGDPHSQRFDIVNKAKIDVSLELLLFQ